MKKRLYLALLLILTMVFVWSGCNADSVEETSENTTSEETDYSNTEESGKEAGKNGVFATEKRKRAVPQHCSFCV